MGDRMRPTRERLQYIRELIAAPLMEQKDSSAIDEAYCIVIRETLEEVDGLNVEIEQWKTRFYASQDTLKCELKSRDAAIVEIKAFADNEMRAMQKEIADLNRLLTEPF